MAPVAERPAAQSRLFQSGERASRVRQRFIHGRRCDREIVSQISGTQGHVLGGATLSCYTRKGCPDCRGNGSIGSQWNFDCPGAWRMVGAVAQLGERLVRNEEVSGSIPLSSTKESTTHNRAVKVRLICAPGLRSRPPPLRCSPRLLSLIGFQPRL